VHQIDDQAFVTSQFDTLLDRLAVAIGKTGDEHLPSQRLRKPD
jgi:hypothetical protein